MERAVNRESPSLDEALDEPVAAHRVWLTTEDLAKRFRTTASTIRYWNHTSYGPKAVRIGRRCLYDPAEVERWEAIRVAEAKA
jgi:hypothetical protein